MDTDFARDDDDVAVARAYLREESAVAFGAVLATFVLVLVAWTGSPVPEIPTAALWFVAGWMVSDTLSMVVNAHRAWQQWRRLVRGQW